MTLILTACSGSGVGQPSGVTSPAASVLVPGEPSPTATSLPESILPSLDGLSYVADLTAESQLLARMTTDAEGALIRSIQTQDGQVLGGVVVRRARTNPPEGEDQAALNGVAGFTNTTGADRVTVKGHSTWQATSAGDDKYTAIGWSEGRNVVVMFAAEPAVARQLAEMYLQAA
jgi:hypothetical protein